MRIFSSFGRNGRFFGMLLLQVTKPDSNASLPPSARKAAMSAMQHETFLKQLESFLETSLKHSGNTLENHETPLKHP